jgi:hypothetical protein
MKSNSFVLSILFIALNGVNAKGAAQSISVVVSLTSENIDEFVNGKTALVEFYAPW